MFSLNCGPGETGSGREIAPIRIQSGGRKSRITRKGKTHRRVGEALRFEARNISTNLLRDRIGIRQEGIPAQSEIHRQSGCQAPSVLDERIHFATACEFCFACRLRKRIHVTQKEIGQSVAGKTAIEVKDRLFLVAGARIEAGPWSNSRTHMDGVASVYP